MLIKRNKRSLESFLAYLARKKKKKNPAKHTNFATFSASIFDMAATPLSAFSIMHAAIFDTFMLRFSNHILCKRQKKVVFHVSLLQVIDFPSTKCEFIANILPLKLTFRIFYLFNYFQLHAAYAKLSCESFAYRSTLFSSTTSRKKLYCTPICDLSLNVRKDYLQYTTHSNYQVLEFFISLLIQNLFYLFMFEFLLIQTTFLQTCVAVIYSIYVVHKAIIVCNFDI